MAEKRSQTNSILDSRVLRLFLWRLTFYSFPISFSSCLLSRIEPIVCSNSNSSFSLFFALPFLFINEEFWLLRLIRTGRDVRHFCCSLPTSRFSLPCRWRLFALPESHWIAVSRAKRLSQVNYPFGCLANDPPAPWTGSSSHELCSFICVSFDNLILTSEERKNFNREIRRSRFRSRFPSRLCSVLPSSAQLPSFSLFVLSLFLFI